MGRIWFHVNATASDQTAVTVLEHVHSDPADGSSTWRETDRYKVIALTTIIAVFIHCLEGDEVTLIHPFHLRS